MDLKQLFFEAEAEKSHERSRFYNFGIFSPIWMKFCMGANDGPKTTQNEF